MSTVSAVGIDPRFRRHSKVEEIHCADGLWVLNKPAGVLSHPNPPAREAPNAILRVPYDFENEAYWVGDGRGRRLEADLVHRLDQDTSGLILLALDPELAAQLKELFYHREVEKEYLALVRGAPRPASGIWRDALRRREGPGSLRVEVVKGAPPNTETAYRTLRVFSGPNMALVALHPQTGRTHQLRVQSAGRGHPIAGDARYGDFEWNRELRRGLGLKRMFLHARRLTLRHPRSGRRLEFVAEADGALAAVLARLGAAPKPAGRRR